MFGIRGNSSRPGTVSVTIGYDGYARLTSYVRTNAGTLSFTYSDLDDRVAMGLASGTRRFMYDPDGRMLGEYGASATDVKAEFVWALPQVANDNTPFGGDDGAGGKNKNRIYYTDIKYLLSFIILTMTDTNVL